jgi:hypothetical protein
VIPGIGLDFTVERKEGQGAKEKKVIGKKGRAENGCRLLSITPTVYLNEM